MTVLRCLDSPWRITFETSPDRCNLNCVMCDTHNPYYNRSRPLSNERILPFELIKKTVLEAKDGIKEIIPSTMGEPLLYPDFEKIIELLRDNELKMNLTTNGTFPKLGVDKWADLIIPVASDVKISMNGATALTAESIMRRLNFNKQVENASKFINKRDIYRRNGINSTVTMQVTFMKANVSELPNMVEMAIEMGFDRFKGHHVWITNDEMKTQTLRTEENIEQWNATVKEMHKIAKNRIKLDNVDFIESGSVIDPNTVCPFLGKEAWIESDGRFEVCCCPDTERSKFGYFGNINDKDLIEIWNSKTYRDFVNGWGSYDPCKHCNMRIGANLR